MYTCMYIYIYVCAYINTYTYIYTHTFISMVIFESSFHYKLFGLHVGRMYIDCLCRRPCTPRRRMTMRWRTCMANHAYLV